MRIPPGFGWLIRIASLFVPREHRASWRSKWQAGAGQWWALLIARRVPPAQARVRLLRYSREAFLDAVRLRFGRDENSALRLGRLIRSPGFCLIAMAAVAAALSAGTHGFSSLRVLFFPLHYTDPDRLVTCSQKTMLGQRIGLPAQKIGSWRAQSTKLAALAAYTTRVMRVGKPPRRVLGAQVTPDFFPAIGVEAAFGRLFREEGDENGRAPVVLSYPLWLRMFGGDPGVIGREIVVDGRASVVVGVLPREFWSISQQAHIWTVLRLDPQPPPNTPYLISAIGRLAPGASSEDAQRELRELALKDKLPWTGKRIQVLPWRESMRPLQSSYKAGILLGVGLVLGAVLVRAGKVSLAAMVRASAHHFWRYWSFLLAKVALMAFVLAGFWLEVTAAAALNQNLLSDALAGAIFNWLFLLVCAALFYGAFRDQARRCPVCLHRLAMPITIGSWSSPLLEPVSTEFLCERGHGALYVPETESSAGERERWTALDESWRELFEP